MHFIVTMPLWLGAIFWVILLITSSNAKKANAQAQLIQRTITAPDGRVVNLVVLRDEPVSTSIARLYPPGTVLPDTASPDMIPTLPRLVPHEVYPNRQSADPPRRAPPTSMGGLLGIGGVIIVVVIALQSRQPVPTTPHYSELARQGSYTPGPSPGTALAPTYAAKAPTLFSGVESAPTARVRLKTGANIRAGGARTAAVLRVARQGEVLVRFGDVNGWIQVGPLGAVQPEGWVAESTVAAEP